MEALSHLNYMVLSSITKTFFLYNLTFFHTQFAQWYCNFSIYSLTWLFCCCLL